MVVLVEGAMISGKRGWGFRGGKQERWGGCEGVVSDFRGLEFHGEKGLFFGKRWGGRWERRMGWFDVQGEWGDGYEMRTEGGWGDCYERRMKEERWGGGERDRVVAGGKKLPSGWERKCDKFRCRGHGNGGDDDKDRDEKTLKKKKDG
ncbi:hypothetical protein ACH5RR_020332 [Cinchona calisaya]|uniref:Uncharacterized protein n=1 Tax=Cinchona calisaya TaxID=153742 RepID=A0ABD2ZJ54_9GENT